MNSKEEVRLYCTLMEEIKLRLAIINNAYQNTEKFPPMIVREICYLQFRFICEIIALACLVAHGDLHEARALKDTYEPGKIIKRLEKVKPFFYPQPMELVRDEATKTAIFAGRPDANHLSQKELPVLWGKAGNILHRSPMVKVLSKRDGDIDNFSDVFDWGAKLTGLLNTHWITLKENKMGMFVSLQAKETNRVAVTLLDFDSNHKEIKLSETWVV